MTDKLREETGPARLNNIDAEAVMGMFSAAKDHAQNATIGLGIHIQNKSKEKQCCGLYR